MLIIEPAWVVDLPDARHTATMLQYVSVHCLEHTLLTGAQMAEEQWARDSHNVASEADPEA